MAPDPFPAEQSPLSNPRWILTMISICMCGLSRLEDGMTITVLHSVHLHA
jgi:hypothetical protein